MRILSDFLRMLSRTKTWPKILLRGLSPPWKLLKVDRYVAFGLLSWTESMWGVQERLAEIVTPRYLAEGTDSKKYLVWMGHLALVICRTWHLDGLKLMSHRFSLISRVWRSFCRVIDSPSELIARYSTRSEMLWSATFFRKWEKDYVPR